ncbi:uncharacterized protein LOC128226462 isoform X3 [Mya arenaria]|uniref:uncharacterized protein LOC128226462 isoform X3 n=1 Tax=Mya arenaria TaxID=6604 RepID=UPI0022E02313|nr:uncharacterized protein LOC128226462 isoform X3 [Mya arenaria]
MTSAMMYQWFYRELGKWCLTGSPQRPPHSTWTFQTRRHLSYGGLTILKRKTFFLYKGVSFLYEGANRFGTYQSGDRELLVQPPTFVNAGHSVTEIEDTSPTDTDFLVNPDFNASRAEQIVASNYKNSDRVKRQATDYEVEIFFVIDYSLYSFWYRHMTGTDLEKQTSAISAIKQFYAFVLNAMSVRYSSVTGSGYTISLVYAGISIATSSTDAPYVENNLQSFDVNGRRAFLAELVLPAFKDWGNTNLKQNYNFDVAMMFTGYEMGRFVNNEFYSATAGLAYTPGACSNLNYNINEDHFGAVLATIAAHELGHNLGAQHDGTVDGNGELCSSDDAYVMAPSFGVSSDEIKNLHRFSFSSCSIDYFTAYITTFNTDGENCLATRNVNYNTSDLDPYLGDLAGQVYTPDQQCEYLEGAGSYLSRISYDSDYSGICSIMNCLVPGSSSFYRTNLAWEGTTCGDGKLCSGGSCVVSSSAPAVANESCMFGNNPSIVTFETVTCSELLAFPNTSYKCYSSHIRQDCCETCEQIRLANVNNADCPYGDRSTSCNAAFCPHYTDESRTVSCCQTCAATATTISTPTTTTPTTTSTTPTTITTTPITTTTAPTTTTTTPTTTTTSLTTTTTTPTATTTTRTTNTPTISTTTPTTSTTTPTTNTPTTIKSTPPPTTTTQTTITTTTTPPTTTTTTTITTTPPPTTTTPTTTTTTTPTKTTTSPTTATTTPTTTRTTNTPTTTRITLTPTTTTTTSPTTTITSPKTTTTSPTTATTSPITTSTSPTTATTTPPTTTTSLSTTTTTPTKTTTSPTTTISSPATMTTTKPTTFITTPTTTKPTTTATTPTTTTITTKRTRVTVVFPIFISPNVDLNEGSSDNLYIALQLRNQLLQIFGLRMGQKVQNILIISLRRGVIADFEIVYEDSVQSIALFTEANIDLLTGKETVTILNETVSASSIQVNTTIVTNETSSGALVCALFEASGGQCDNGYECATVDGAPTCHRQKTSDEMTLIIVVVTGSLVFLLITSIVICVSVRERRKYNLPN